MAIGNAINKFLPVGFSAELDPVPAADNDWEGMYMTMTNNTGATINYGDSCVFDNTAGEIVLSDAGNAGLATLICVETANVANTASGKFLCLGVIRDDAWAWTIGGPIYRSGTAGALTQTAPSTSGDRIQVVGIATSADSIYWNPSLSQSTVA
jgi:hypothetical protein